MERLVDGMENSAREHVERYSRWEYAPFCGVLYVSSLQAVLLYKSSYGHAIQTLETDFRSTFDTTNLQLPHNWTYGNGEELRISLLYNDESEDEWDNFIRLLKEFVKFLMTPWDENSPIYLYHRARFELQYLTERDIA